MPNLPGVLGNAAPPTGDELQRTLRGLQQQIDALVTARTIQASETSAFVTESYNGSTDGWTFPGGDIRTLAHYGEVDAPITCSQVIVHVVVTAGDTGGGGLFVSGVVCGENETPGNPGTVSEEVATEVTNYASLTTSFVRVLDGQSQGTPVGVGVYVGTPSAGSAGNGNGHVSAMLVFVR